MNSEPAPVVTGNDRASENRRPENAAYFHLGMIAAVSGLERSGKLNAKVALKQIRSILASVEETQK